MKCLDFWTLFIYLLLFLDPDVLCNLENENELLASMDIDHPVCNSTKFPKKLATKKQNQSRDINKLRLFKLRTKAETKNTKDNIKYVISVYFRVEKSNKNREN